MFTCFENSKQTLELCSFRVVDLVPPFNYTYGDAPALSTTAEHTKMEYGKDFCCVQTVSMAGALRINIMHCPGSGDDAWAGARTQVWDGRPQHLEEPNDREQKRDRRDLLSWLRKLHETCIP